MKIDSGYKFKIMQYYRHLNEMHISEIDFFSQKNKQQNVKASQSSSSSSRTVTPLTDSEEEELASVDPGPPSADIKVRRVQLFQWILYYYNYQALQLLIIKRNCFSSFVHKLFMKIEGINLININLINELNIDILYLIYYILDYFTYMSYSVAGSSRSGSSKSTWNLEAAFGVGVQRGLSQF